MIGWRDKPTRRLGASLGGFALVLQLGFASWSMWAQAAPTGPADAFGGHALCLAATGAATHPADGAPLAPSHDHTAFCCLWHTLAALHPVVPPAPQPVDYARAARIASGDTPFIPGPSRGPANARAPPAPA
jgi:hypothetical protein